MPRTEQNFERRLQRILELKGFTVLNVRMPRFGGHKFDLIAFRHGLAFPIEVKGKCTPYPEAQKKRQIALATRCHTNYFVCRQSKRRGLMTLQGYSVRLKMFEDTPDMALLQEALEEWIE